MWGCGRAESISEIPEIHFKQLIFEDRTDPLDETFKMAILTFSFIDGDGDIGVRQQDRPDNAVSRIHYTWYTRYPDMPYKFQNDSINHSSEIPYGSVMDKSEAQNKVLKGTIEIELQTPISPQGVDTMRIEFYIVDRAAHKSNVV